VSGGGVCAEPGAALPTAAPLAFTYARSLAPMMWVLVALGCGELLVVHLLVALLWSPMAALVLTLAALAAIAWLVLLIRSMGRLPVLVGEREVVMRAGALKAVTVARSNIAAVETSFPPGFLRRPGVLSLALLAYPNVALELREPLASRRRGAAIEWIALRLDEPAAFVAALAAG
jgi:hypothetical protein